MPNLRDNFYIVVGPTRIYLDRAAFEDCELKIQDDEVLSEQCEECGEDIMENGSARPEINIVRCETCSTGYEVQK